MGWAGVFALLRSPGVLEGRSPQNLPLLGRGVGALRISLAVHRVSRGQEPARVGSDVLPSALQSLCQSGGTRGRETGARADI